MRTYKIIISFGDVDEEIIFESSDNNITKEQVINGMTVLGSKCRGDVKPDNNQDGLEFLKSFFGMK